MKNLMRFLLLVCVCLMPMAQMQVYAQQQQSETSQGLWYEISDFSGGLKSHVSPYLTPSDSLTDALNVRFNTQYGNVSKRDQMLLLSTCHAAPVKSLYRYYKSDQTEYILQTSSTYLDYVNDTTGVCTQLMTTLTDGKRWTWVTYKDIATGTDGTDAPVKWDGLLTATANTNGARTAGDLVTQLGAPFAQLNTGTDLMASKWYQYRVAFYDGSVYKFSTARSNPLLTGTSVHDINLSDIPLGPIGTTSRIIYRTLGQSTRSGVIADTTFYNVGVIADNATRTFIDTVPDATADDDTAPTWSTVSGGIDATPPFSLFALIHQERLFLANDPSGTPYGKSTLYWSDVLNPDYFNTASDFVLIRPDDGDEITVLSNLYGIMTIAKTNTWEKFYTDAATTAQWSLSDPFDYFGCTAPYSATNGVGGIYYLSRSGIRMFDSQKSQLISDVITDHVKDINAIDLNDVVGVYQDNQYELSYTSLSSGSAINDQVLVLDLTRNAYALDAKNIDSFAAFNSGLDSGILFSGSSNTDGSVYAHSGSFNTLINRYKSDLDAGTFSSTVSNGTEDNAYLSLGSSDNWQDDSTMWSSESTKTWLVDATPGTWISPIVEIDASKLDKVYWNEQLGSFGNVTFAVRTASSASGIPGASWSSEVTTPSGSDISGTAADKFIQIRATLSTSNFSQTPTVFLDDSFIIKLTYNKSGTTGESSILSFIQTGYTGLTAAPVSQTDLSVRPKVIKEILVYYTGTAGTLTLSVNDDNNQTALNIPIDLSVDPTSSSADQYYGTKTEKIYDFIPDSTDQPLGRKFRFSVTENGSTVWGIKKIAVRYDASPATPYR